MMRNKGVNPPSKSTCEDCPEQWSKNVLDMIQEKLENGQELQG